MVRHTLQLNSESFLELLPAENDWTTVWLSQSGERIELGAETFSIIAERVLKAFKEFSKKPIVGNWDGIPAVGVISLYEKHATLFLGKSASESILFIEDENGSLMSKIVIDPRVVSVLEHTPLAGFPPSWPYP